MLHGSVLETLEQQPNTTGGIDPQIVPIPVHPRNIPIVKNRLKQISQSASPATSEAMYPFTGFRVENPAIVASNSYPRVVLVDIK